MYISLCNKIKNYGHGYSEYTEPDAKGDIGILHSIHHQARRGISERYRRKNEIGQPQRAGRNALPFTHQIEKCRPAYLPMGRKRVGAAQEIFQPYGCGAFVSGRVGENVERACRRRGSDNQSQFIAPL